VPLQSYLSKLPNAKQCLENQDLLGCHARMSHSNFFWQILNTRSRASLHVLLCYMRFTRHKLARLHRTSHVEEVPNFSKLAMITSNNRRYDAWSRQSVDYVIKIVGDVGAWNDARSFEPL